MSIDKEQLKALALRMHAEDQEDQAALLTRGEIQAFNSLLEEWEDATRAVTILALLAEIESLRQDAERYRWLRAEGYRDVDTDQWSGEGEAMDAFVDASMAGPGKNEGHGHVFTRSDGVRARCGGPGLCKVCSADLARKEKGQ